MGELLFDPIEVQRSLLRNLYEMLKGKSPEERERFLAERQISQPLALAVRLGIEPEKLT